MKRKIRVTFDSSIKQKFNIAGEVLVTYVRLTQDENKRINEQRLNYNRILDKLLDEINKRISYL